MSQITRWDPFEDLFKDFRGLVLKPVDMSAALAEAPTIRIDVKEQPASYSVHAELPGVKKEDIHVHIDGALVSISAERKQEKEVKEGERVLRTERHFGKVSRSFQLAQDVDESRSSAKFVDGVLDLVLPKKTTVAARKLPIE